MKLAGVQRQSVVDQTTREPVETIVVIGALSSQVGARSLVSGGR